MKRIITILFVLLVSIAVGAEVYAGQSNYGCGLGSLIFKGNDGLISQTAAVTLNGFFGNQIFGITTGTSNCRKFSSLASNEKINIFVADNMDNLATDIAKGNGEYLNTLAVLMDIPEKDRKEFYKKMQTNFSRIYTSKGVTHDQVIKNISALM
ncbi:MAG TPA: DUF3015 domain-containing protein [Spirochaetes bacterium]|mgnify:CR=1 FL=1|nr:DUF3015 domain-containing protein [Spirochaetota bacterium]